MSQNYEEVLYNAMSAIAGEALTKAGYDRTIQATILKCSDPNAGKYVVKYQDSKFEAYSANVQANYSSGVQVYVLIPGNDMTKHKTIIGAVKNEGLSNNRVIPESSRYIEYGNNLITLKQEFGLCSYYSNSGNIQYIKVTDSLQGGNPHDLFLYEYDQDQSTYFLTEDTVFDPNKVYYSQIEYLGRNYITIYSSTDNNLAKDEEKDYIIETDKVIIDLAGIREFLASGETVDSLKIGGVFRTSLPSEQQTEGDYGLKFTFLAKQEDTETTKEFLFSIDSMTGDPYRYYVNSEQVSYLDIKDFKIIGLKEIIFYDRYFPHDAEENEDYSNDIFLNSIILQGCEQLSYEDLMGTFLRVTTPQGTNFFPNDIRDTLTINAQVWDAGSPIDNSANSLGYYWFEEKASTKKYVGNSQTINPDYDNFGGNGWKCLSPIIAAGGHSPDSNTLIIKKSDIPLYQKRYMSVAIYNAQRMSKEILITNLAAQYKVELTTDSGRSVFLKNENQDVKVYVKIYYREDSSKDWAENLPTTISNIAWYYQDQWGNYQQAERVSPSDRYMIVSLKDFTSSFKVLCEITIDGKVGTQSLTLQKVSSADKPYTLRIINNNGPFVYDEQGISPTNEKNKSPVKIAPLTYQIIDNRTNEIIDGSSLPEEKALWSFPAPETSLINSPNSDYLELKGAEMPFTLDDEYKRIQNVNNTIELRVEFNGLSLLASENILCLKQGENGTNGTGYSIKIVPLTQDEDGPWLDSYFPIVPFKKNGSIIEASPKVKATTHWFDVALYFEGRKIFQNSLSGDVEVKDIDSMDNSNTNTYVKVKWEFKKHSKEDWEENSFYEVTEDGEFTIKDNLSYLDFTEQENQNYCHIVQVTVTYKGKDLIATQSIGTLIWASEEQDDKDDIYLKSDSGFEEVIYQADGASPQYTKTPFVFIEKAKIIDGTYVYNKEIPNEDIQWTAAGVYKDNGNLSYSNDLKISKLENSPQVVPATEYSGFCLTNAVVATIDSLEVQIHLPIQFYLNRYANKAINGWDGNSININNDDGIILAPQIGAGKKEADNSFTGVIIGVSKTAKEQETKEETGLFGFTHGKRSVFIDSEDGSATFGISDIGSIEIRPSINQYGEVTGEPVIESGNYKPKKNGEEGSGLSIAFGKNPYIYYGNNKFMVNQDGELTANGATINGKFKAQNLNSWDKSKILIGADSEREQSEILLYGYKSVKSQDENNPDRYVTSKTHIAPGVLDLSLYNISDYEEIGKLPKASSYLRFNDSQLQLKGGFESEAESAKVSFQDNSNKTYINFINQKINESYKSVEVLEEEIKNYRTQQEGIVSQAIEHIQSTEGYEPTEEEARRLLDNWYNYLRDMQDKESILEGMYSDLAQIEEIDKTLQADTKYIDSLNEVFKYQEEVILKIKRDRQEYVKNQQSKGRLEKDIQHDTSYIDYSNQILQVEEKKQDILNSETALLNKISTLRTNFLDLKESLKNALIEQKIKIYTTEELEDGVDYYIFEDLIFRKDAIDNDKIALAKKISLAKEYAKIEKNIIENQSIIHQINVGLIGERRIFTESMWSPQEFYFKSYEDGNGNYGYISKDNRYVRSELSYDPDSGQLKYVGSLDFEAEPFARLVLSRKSENGNNSSQLYFKTYFELPEKKEGKYSTSDLNRLLKTSIQLKPGFMEIKSKENETDKDFSSIRMTDGKITLKNIEFKLRTEASDVSFSKDSKETWIKFYNRQPIVDEYGNLIYGEEGEPIYEEIGKMIMTPKQFQLKAGKSGLYVNPEKNSLNYIGNISVSNSHGLFVMKDSNMALRFGTTVADYPNDPKFEGVPTDQKVTDFSISPTGFSIKGYGITKEDIDLSNDNQFYTTANLEKEDTDIIDYFSHEFIPEDNIKFSEEFKQNYINIFYGDTDNSEESLAEMLDMSSTEIEDTFYKADSDENSRYITIDTEDSSIIIPKTEMPSFLDDSICDPNYKDKWETSIADNAKWTEKSGLSYNTKSGKLRLNGDLSVRNEHGTILFSDDMMRIMFRKFVEDDSDNGKKKPLSRMCLSEDSFYFYSFGSVRDKSKDNVKSQKGLVVVTTGGDSTEKISYKWGITGAIVWRNGKLKIIGTVEATDGYVGGWTISDSFLTSANGSVELDGQTGTLYLKNGMAKGSTTEGVTAGAIRSEFFNRRASLALGEILVEGIDTRYGFLQEKYEELVSNIQEQQNNYLNYLEEHEPDFKVIRNDIFGVFPPNTIDISGVCRNVTFGNFVSAFNIRKGSFSSQTKEMGRMTKNSIASLRETFIEVVKAEIVGGEGLTEEQLKSTSGWANFGHLSGGYGATEGLFLAAEGQKKYYLQSSENPQEGTLRPRGIYFGLNLQREDVEDKIFTQEAMQKDVEAECQQDFETITAESGVASILPVEIPEDFIKTFSVNVKYPKKEAEITWSETEEAEDGTIVKKGGWCGSLNFAVGLLTKNVPSGNEDNPDTPDLDESRQEFSDYIYGTQIFPHVIKTNDVLIEDNYNILKNKEDEDFIEYHSNSLVEMLKELRETPTKISYIEDITDEKNKDFYDRVVERYEGSIPGIEHKAYISEQWNTANIGSYVEEDTLTVYKETKESMNYERIWELDLQNVEGSSDKEVTSITLIIDGETSLTKKVDLSGFIVSM